MRRWMIAAAALLCSGTALAQNNSYETGTIQPAGPRQGTAGDNFFNVEAASFGAFASYGVARWDLSSAIGEFNTEFGVGNWELCKIDLIMTQNNAGFTNSGKVLLYYSPDNTTDAKTASSPLTFPLVPSALSINASDPLINYAFVEVATGQRDTILIYAKGDAGERGVMADTIESGGNVLTLVFNPNDPNTPNVAATYSGQTGGSTGFPPELVLTAITLGGGCAPVANAGPDQTVVDVDFDQTENITLDGSGSFATASGASIVDYTWTVGMTTIATGVMPTVAFGLGSTTVTLTIEDDLGGIDTDQVVITILPGGDPPFADAGPAQEQQDTDGDGQEIVTLDGSNSSDSDGTIVNYTWVDKLTGAVLASGASPTANVPLGLGLHTIELQVEDNAGHVVKDWTFVKVLPQTIYGRHDFDGNSADTFSQFPGPGAFSSPGDGFQVYQRGVSPSVPFGLLDDSGSAGTGDPNNPECAVFPFDNLGMIPCAKRDAWFGAIDLNNPDNAACDRGEVLMTFNITGASDIQVSIDMWAMGDFEAEEPGEEEVELCDPNAGTQLASLFDRYDWWYSIDGGPEQMLFKSIVDEDDSQDYELFGGAVYTLNDPLLVNGVMLSNIGRTLTASIAGTGTTLTLRLDARGDGGEEAYAFDDVIVFSQPTIAPCPGDCDGSGDVGLSDLVAILSNFADPTVGNCEGGLVGLVDVLSNFGTTCP